MASVSFKSGRWYAILWHKETRKREWVKLPETVKTEKDARKKASTLQAKLETETLQLSSDTETWLNVAAKVADDIKATRGKKWHSAVDHFNTRFITYAAESPITPELCRQYAIDRQADGANLSTLRKELTFLHRVFERCVKSGLYSANPFDEAEIPPEPTHGPRFLSRAEFNALHASAPDPRSFRYLFLVSTGARANEALAAKWEDVDWKAMQIRIKNSQKGKKPPRYPFRFVPIPPDLMDELTTRKGHPKELIFPYQINWTRDFTVDAIKAGLRTVTGKRDKKSRHRRSEGARLHDLRHTFGSWLAQAGVPLQEIRDLMGHQSIKTTEIYAHLLPSKNPLIVSVFLNLCRTGVENQAEKSERQA